MNETKVDRASFDSSHPGGRLSGDVLLRLKRWNTPTIYNGWEQITRRDVARGYVNAEPIVDFMPQMGPMVGYAVTLKIKPSDARYRGDRSRWSAFREYVGKTPDPKIVVVQDLDKPETVGSFWGEVNANVHRSLGCVGCITDGAVRDLDEMTSAGFKALARRLCVGHAHVTPIEWNVAVEVFGVRVEPGRLIHADKHGFLVVPAEDEAKLLDASLFMDDNECKTVIVAAKRAASMPINQALDELNRASEEFAEEAKRRFGGVKTEF
jgi:regulator of RNase E activity RraA